MVHAADQLNLPSDVIAPRHDGLVDGLDGVLPAARPAEALTHNSVDPSAEDGCTNEIVVEDVVAAFVVRRDAAGRRDEERSNERLFPPARIRSLIVLPTISLIG